MTIVLIMLAVLAGFFALMLALDPQRRKQAAYGTGFVLAAGAFGLADGIPTIGGDAMAQPGCSWDGTTLTCPPVGGVESFCDNPGNWLHGLCYDYSGGGYGGTGYAGSGHGGGGGYGSVNSGFADGYYGANSNPFPSSNLLPPARVIRNPAAPPLRPPTCEELALYKKVSENVADILTVGAIAASPWGPLGRAAGSVAGLGAVVANRKARGYADDMWALGCI